MQIAADLLFETKEHFLTHAKKCIKEYNMEYNMKEGIVVKQELFDKIMKIF